MSDTSEPTDANTLRRLFQLYCRHKLAAASPHTKYQYWLNHGRFTEFLGREPMLTDLRDDTVAEALQWLIRTKKLSAASASKMRDCLIAAWKFGARKGIVSHWPDVADVREPRRVPVAWTREELARLWEYLSRMPGELCGIAASDWFCSLHAVLYDTGERIGATLQTEWQQVDLEGGWIVIRAETRKGRLSDQLSRLHPATVDLLWRIREPERRLVWPWPYHSLYIWRVYGSILKKAGLPSGRDRKFHCIRKTCATHITALAGPAAAQTALGHTDGRITREVYTDPRQVPRQFPADILPRPWDDGPKAA